MVYSEKDDVRGGWNISHESWLLFCLAVLVVKFVLFELDPLPKFYGGDSKDYLWTALSGWIPEDHSFLYGYIIRWVALSTSSLTSLLVLQVFAGAIIAIASAWICLRIFKLPSYIAFTVGFLCCLEPIQLYWERAVMTETLSLMLYILLLQRSFIYITTKRLRELILIQLLSVLLISFRMSYLALIYITTVALPIIAFWPWRHGRKMESSLWTRLRASARRNILRPAGHLLLSVALMYALHTSYKHLNGSLSHRKPEYLYVTGIFLLSFWAPALKPSDAPNPRLAELIRNGNTFSIKELNARGVQLFWKGFLVDKLYQIEPDPVRADALARQTALHAFKRNPLAIAWLAWQTYLKYWRDGVKTWALEDIPRSGQFADVEVARLGLVDRFHQAVTPMNMKPPLTLTTRYYLTAGWWCYLVLVSPAILVTLIVLERSIRHYLVILFLHQAALFSTIFALSVCPVVRYLQPLSLITLLTFAAGTKIFIDRQPHSNQRRVQANTGN